jgi:phage tail-like protein
VEPEFWDTLRAQRGVALVEPAAIAVALWQGQERLLVVDKGDAALKLFRTDGMYDDAATRVWTGFAVKNPAGLGIGGDRLYVGDADTASVLVFDLTGSLLGVVAAPQGTLCGLALDARGRLVLHAGSGTPILQLLSGQVFAREGRFLIGPIDVGGHSTTWQRLEVLGPLPTGNGHLRLHTLTSAQPVAPPAIPASASVEVTETPLDMWRSAPADALDARIFNAPGRYLWIAGVMVGDGTTSPLVRRIRVEYDRESWLRRLPAVYTPSPEQRDPADTLGGALALFRSTLEGEDRGIDGMSRRFDALAAPAEGAPQSWLDWLAGWLALVLPQDWSEGRKRDALRRIFRLYAWRGTAEGLEAFIEMYTGARARIIEPSQAAAVWALGADSRLGFGTPLGGAEAQGAVLGTTAEPGLSSLTTDGQYGTPLFEDRAHEFCVQVYAAEIKTPGAVELVRQVVEQEKPAHTAARVQVIDALLRVGIQATLGVDAIVAGPREMALGKGGLLGTDTALAAEPDRLTEGESPQLGLTSRLS